MTYPTQPSSSAPPSPPTSPTSPRTRATRVRIKPLRQDSTGNVSSTLRSKPHAERTRSMSPSFPEIVTADLVTFGSELRTIAPASASVVASKRRQSAIAYYTPSSPSPWSQRPQLSGTHSSDGPREVSGPVVADARENASKRSSLVLSSRSHSTRESLSSTDAGPREREPLTLVEKHADLLHFIAQKERRCLELRDQLTAHEKELAELKRKWERIVNGGHDPLPNRPLTAGIGGVALDGLKEGVRMIAAGFSDLGGAIHELESDKGSSKSEPKTLVYGAHETDVSESPTTQMGSEQLSASSMSSIQQNVHTSDQVLDTRDEDTITVAAVSSLSRADSLNTWMHKRTLRVTVKEPMQTSSSVFSPTQRPKSAHLDVDMSLVLGPGPTLVPPTLGAVSDSSSPGPVISSTHRSGPVSSWMDSMSKKLNDLQNGQTFSKSQKRASLLFAGVSSTIGSALLPGPTATTPAPIPISMPSTSRSKLSLTTRPLSPRSPAQNQSESRELPTYRSMMDWLDDDEEEQAVQPERLLAPESNPPLCSATDGSTVDDEAGTTPTAVSSFDDDDWNW